jgi:hypothetical protein
MSSTFDAYYYDQFGKQANLTGQEALARKMDVAKEVLGGMLGKLAPGDHVSIVLFSDSACTPLGLTPVSCLDIPRLADQIQASRMEGPCTQACARARARVLVPGQQRRPAADRGSRAHHLLAEGCQ